MTHRLKNSKKALDNTTNLYENIDDKQTIHIEEYQDTGTTIIRRLTPTECGRLQGMPDWWCEDVPHSDSAEYKMWGNGMALPNVLYVMEGVADMLTNRKQSSKPLDKSGYTRENFDDKQMFQTGDEAE